LICFTNKRRKFKFFILILLCIVGFCDSNSFAVSYCEKIIEEGICPAVEKIHSDKRAIEYRMWQFHTPDEKYVSDVLKKTADYNINSVVYSHEMFYTVDELYQNPNKAKMLRTLTEEAHDLGLKVFVWPHELWDVPKEFLKDGIVQLDNQGFYKWLTDKYDKFFRDFPEFDGIILTFHETNYPVFKDDKVKSKLSKPERFARIINAIDKACSKYNKDFIVRTFVYEPEELKWLEEGLKMTHPRVMVQSKCVPHDWQPFYPHSPVIGAFKGRKQIVEFDCSSEFTGKNRIPYTSPEYFEYRWNHGLKFPEVVGYNARLDHRGFDAVFTPNKINLYTLYCLTEDASVDAAKIWDEWLSKEYGDKAGPLVKDVLKPTFDCVNKAFFAQKFWYTNHSALPSWDYANNSISPSHKYSGSLTKWIDEPDVKKTEDLLNRPTPEFLEQILAEKNEAVDLAKQCLVNLEKAKPYLKPDRYNDLKWRLDLLSRVTVIWRAHAEAFWGIKLLEQNCDDAELKERTKNAIDVLYQQANLISKDANIADTVPANSENVKKVARELELKLKQLYDN